MFNYTMEQTLAKIQQWGRSGIQWQVLHSSMQDHLPELERRGLVKQVGPWVVASK
jgi:hypothetical protein